MVKHVLLIGRWCPFHNGHKYLVDSYLASGTPVCIAIRATEEKYSVRQRKEMIRAVYPNTNEVDIIVIPDISGVAVGREVGYFISKVPREIEEISATKIRAGVSNDVPREVKRLIDYYKNPPKVVFPICGNCLGNCLITKIINVDHVTNTCPDFEEDDGR